MKWIMNDTIIIISSIIVFLTVKEVILRTTFKLFIILAEIVLLI